MLHTALTPRERTAVAIEAYDALHIDGEPQSLFEWEQAWFANRLPPPPARVLVGAAGSGREAIGLRAMGYRVDAVEPATRPARECQRRLGDDGCVWNERLEEIARRALGGAMDSYDAVLIGWAGLSHILEPQDRALVLRGCDRLAPEGPILASFFLGTGDSRMSRSQRVGDAAGRLIARLRGVSSNGAAPEPLCFASWFGFAKPFREAELTALGDAIGRRTVFEGEGTISTYPHATFLPAGG